MVCTSLTPRPRSLFATALALAALVPAGARAQSPPSASNPAATVPAAIGLMQQGRLDEAVRLLEQVTGAEPENARAWNFLAQAHRRAGRPDDAIAAYQRALELLPENPQFRYGLGVAYALRGDPDRAFDLLKAAKASGTFNTTNIGNDPAAESLRDDPRYRELFPTDAEFAAPFVEPTRIIHDWHGEAAGDQFGWIARNIGDVDGDGVDDATTSAPTKVIEGQQNAGRVYAYSGRTGALLWTADGRAGEQLGLGIEAAGDVTGDGTADVIAGAPGADRAYVFDGKDGSVALLLEGEPGEFFGREVMDLGDVDGDGHADVIVGAPRSDAAGEDAGRAYVISGADGSRLLTLDGPTPGASFGSAAGGFVVDGLVMLVIGAPGAGSDGGGLAYVYRGQGLTEAPAFVIGEDDVTAQLGGMFVSVVGDIDADGHPDAYASDWANAAKGNSTGRVYVYSGRTGEPLHVLTGEAAGDGFGIGPADAGDVNGDGHDDLVIGAWQHAGAAPSGGKVYVYSGRDGALLRSITSRVMGETFGFDATGLGDVDGDGTIDYLLTSAWSAIAGTQSGRTLVISGAR